jgi:hypothetical protein
MKINMLDLLNISNYEKKNHPKLNEVMTSFSVYFSGKYKEI